MSEPAIEVPEFKYDPLLHRGTLGDVELPSVTKILDRCGLISPWLKREDRYAVRGTDAHDACRYLFEQRLDWSTVRTEIMGYVVSLDRWLEQTRFQAEACEVTLFHLVFLFYGTYDVKGVLPDYGRCLLDLKTAKVCALSHRIQTAGYEVLEGGHRKRGCLHLQEDGKIAKFIPHRDSSDRLNWQSCLNVYRLQEAA